jgi:hypothetical protein
MNDEALKAAYLAGFNASGEGYNGEYPFGDHVQDPEEDAAWRKNRDESITAIKQALTLDKKAENARELGLDYEPVALIDRLINPEQHYEFTDPKKANAVLMSLCQEAADALAAPVQEPVGNWIWSWLMDWCKRKGIAPATQDSLFAMVEDARNKFTTPPAAQRQWVGLTDAEKQWIRITEWTIDELIEWVNTKLKEKNT